MRTQVAVLVGVLLAAESARPAQPLVAGPGALDVYGSLTGKTVLAPAALPPLPDSIIPNSLTDTNKAIAAIETALAEKGLEVVQDGPHFMRVFTQATRDFMTNGPLRGAELALAKDQEALPAGAINFAGADLRQVLDIYALMTGRTVLRPATLPSPVIRLRTACPLTKDEGVYALETVLALNGICVVDDGARFVQVVAAPQRTQVKARAPKTEPGAETMPTGSIDFRGADLNQVLAVYASISQRTILRPASLPGPAVSVQSASALTRQEVVYAMATVFALNGISLKAV